MKADEGASSEDEILVCVVPRQAPLDVGELCEYLSERMPAFAVPRYVRVMDHLPKTPTERVRKVELRDAGVTSDTYDRMHPR